MKCARFEELIGDYLDASTGLEDRRRIEDHAALCPGCSEKLADTEWAAGFLRDIPAIEPPPDLVANILKETATVGGPLLVPAGSDTGGGLSAWLSPFFRPWVEPRFVMSMAMVLLSFSMITYSSERVWHDWQARGMGPSAVVRQAGQQFDRVWARSVEICEMVWASYRIESAGSTASPRGGEESSGGESSEPLGTQEQR